MQRTAAHCNALQRTATHCNALQRTAAHCNSVEHVCHTSKQGLFMIDISLFIVDICVEHIYSQDLLVVRAAATVN